MCPVRGSGRANHLCDGITREQFRVNDSVMEQTRQGLLVPSVSQFIHAINVTLSVTYVIL